MGKAQNGEIQWRLWQNSYVLTIALWAQDFYEVIVDKAIGRINMFWLAPVTSVYPWLFTVLQTERKMACRFAKVSEEEIVAINEKAFVIHLIW